jgi:hypothetical protein
LGLLSGGFKLGPCGDAQSFIAFDRDQELLLPPDLRDRLPRNHLAWFVVGAVEEMARAIEKMLRDIVIVYDDGSPRTKHLTDNLH